MKKCYLYGYSATTKETTDQYWLLFWNNKNNQSCRWEKKKTEVKTGHSSAGTLQPVNGEKWKTTSLAKFGVENWLIIDVENNSVKSLRCNVCQKNEDRITSVKDFQETWCCEGSRRLQHVSAVLHAEGKAHEVAYDLFLKEKGKSANERTNILKETLRDNRQVGIADSRNTMNVKDFELTKKKFEVTYFVAKEELPLSLFPKLLSLEERHGVELGTTYCHCNYAGKIIDYISEKLANDLKVSLKNANFYSVLTYGSTDASKVGKKSFLQFVLILHPSEKIV